MQQIWDILYVVIQNMAMGMILAIGFAFMLISCVSIIPSPVSVWNMRPLYLTVSVDCSRQKGMPKENECFHDLWSFHQILHLINHK